MNYLPICSLRSRVRRWALVGGAALAVLLVLAGCRPASRMAGAAMPGFAATTAPAATAGPVPSTGAVVDREEVATTPELPTPSLDSAQAPGRPPAAPALALRKSSDTGVSDSDLLTGNNMPTFEGYAQAGATVALYDGTTLVGTAPVDPTGYWAYMVDVDAGLNDGLHPMTAIAIDRAGNSSLASAVLNVRIDTQPPDMPVMTSEEAGSSDGAGVVTLSGTAPISSTVTVLEGRAPLASPPVNGNGGWSVTIENVQPGLHDYRASATDAAGVTSPANDTMSIVVKGDPANWGVPLATGTASQVYTGTVVAVAAGDIACGAAGGTASCQQMATSDILVNANPDVVFALGDNQYECGSLADFSQYYGPSWGRLLGETHPAAGNHEYETSAIAGDPCYAAVAGAPGYFQYFGNAASPAEPGCAVDCKGYYSYDVGAWHVIVLNSVCGSVGGCGLGSPEETWLKNDLAAHPTGCVLAYWHYPRFSSGLTGNTFMNGLKAFWQDLYNAGADVVLNGHDHDYERFSRLDVSGHLDTAHGIREFVVGTGGRSRHDFAATAAWSQVRNNTTFGVLELRLSPGAYSWQFLPVAGLSFTDSGSETCRS